MASQGQYRGPAACPACSRADPTRHFFCRDCISSCLVDHNACRQQLRNALTLVTAKATALLSGTDRTPSSPRARALGVAEERLLKADKWVLASRAYAARDAVVKAKQANSQAEDDLTSRRAALAARRANLSTARSLHSSLSSLSPSTSSLSLPDSLPALAVRIENLSNALTALDGETARVRGILKRELLAVVALAPLERPLADPFLSYPAPSRSLSGVASPAASPSFSTATTTPTRRRTQPSQTYTLSSLPLPPLASLLSLPPPTLEALLSHLAHLVRLVALYDREALPFAPVMGLFGPGRAGVRAGPGWGVAAGAGTGDEDGKAAGAGAGSSARRKGALGTAVWPLVFGSRRRAGSVAATALGGSDGAGDGSVDADAYGDGDDADDYYHASATSYARTSSTSSSTASAAAAAAPTSSSARSSTSKRSTKRAKLVLGGAVALALDFAFLAWARERRAGAAGGQWRLDDLDDLGALIRRATGVLDGEEEGDGGAGSGREGAGEGEGGAHAFPLSMADALAHYTALALGPSSASTPSSRAGRSRAALEESGVVVEGEPGFEVEDDDDEGWDLVSV
ncbi:hypothetical protein JCM9279_002202 [Rhodotorula babjevae]